MIPILRHRHINNATFISGVIVLIGLLFVFAPTARAIESANIGVLPANPRADNPRTNSIFVFEVKPGASAKDGVKVVNNSNETKNILLYAVDAQNSSDGAFACAQKADEQTGVGQWTKLTKTRVTLAPNSTEIVPFTLTMPANADVGEHNGCIAVQEDVPATQDDSSGIVLSFRSALRVAVVVPGDISAKLGFVDIIRETTAQKVRVSPIVKNDGNVSVDASIDVRLVNIFGSEAAQAGGTFVVLSDQESRFNFELDRPFWGGWYQQKVSARYSPLRLTAADPAAAQTTAADPEWVFVGPTPAALLVELGILALLIGGAAYVLWRRQQQKLLAARTDIYIVEAGDNLQSIATEVNANWRRLAKLNQLKPPYALAPGQEIKVPQMHDTPKPQKSSK